LGEATGRHPRVPRVNEGGTLKPEAQRHLAGTDRAQRRKGPLKQRDLEGTRSPRRRNRTSSQVEQPETGSSRCERCRQMTGSMLLSHPPTRKQRLRTRVRSLCFILLCIWDKCIVILRTPGGENQFATQTQRRTLTGNLAPGLGGILHWDRLRQPLRDAQRMSPWKESTNECVNLLELNMNMRHQYGTLSGQ